jgi:hypothetical protein
MLHLEHHSFARRQPPERRRDSPADFQAQETPFRIGRRALLLLPVEKVTGGIVATRLEPGFRRLIFGPAAPATQMIEANICYDAIHPSIETALEAEAVQILINFQKCFLVDVAGIFWLVQNVQGDSQDVTVVTMDERFKRFAITRLRAFDQGSVVWRCQRSPRRSGGGAFSTVSAAVSGPSDCHSVSCHLVAIISRGASILLDRVEHTLICERDNPNLLDA